MRNSNKIRKNINWSVKILCAIVWLIAFTKLALGVALTVGMIWLIITLIRYFGG